MLRELVVEGLGVVERTEVGLDPGMTALTGETGAGKTLMVAAVALLLGGKADREIVRQDAGEARVEGRFEVPAGHAAAEVLARHGLIDEPGSASDVVVHRTVGMTGGGRVRVNGRLSNLQLLAEVTAPLVEIAGQHEHQRLNRPSHQRDLLDAFAGGEAEDLAAQVREQVRRLNAARRTLDDLRRSADERRREMERLQHELAEIEDAALTPGEFEALTAEARRLEAAADAEAGIGAARDAVRGEGGAVEALQSAAARLRDAATGDPELARLAERLESVSVEAADVGDELLRRAVEPDPERLAEVRERLDRLGRLRRRYAPDEEGVLEHARRAGERLGQLAGEADDLERLSGEIERTETEAREAAGRLRELRTVAAERLGREATTRLTSLAMGGTQLEVRVTETELYEGGTENVELLLGAGGAEPRPLTKVASGGELSRVALALHLMVRGGSAPTLVFDEVDAGVGGEAALAVADALATLAGPSRQVVVVTHLAQVAARADHHLRVVKEAAGPRIRARVEPVSGDERVEEVSRMLAGMPDSQSARDHAQELLGLRRTGAA